MNELRMLLMQVQEEVSYLNCERDGRLSFSVQEEVELFFRSFFVCRSVLRIPKLMLLINTR